VVTTAVIWDFGGVLTTSPFEAFERYERARALPVGYLRAINAADPDANAWAKFERAEIDAAAFDTLFLAESTARGHPVPGRDVLPLLSGEIRPAMVAALKACKERFKVGCITNNLASGRGAGMAASEAARCKVAEVMSLFDALIESSKAGVRKPDPAIYRMMCDRLGVRPQDCIYLDDLGINCKPAAALGMTAIKVVSEAQTLADLARLTGLDLADARLEMSA
jgi:putative hydrolase of the HAD superfamily